MDTGVQWFEIPVTDMARASTFYTTVLGKTLTKYDDMPGMEMMMFPWKEGAPFAGGSLVKSANSKPSREGVVIYFTCEDIADELTRVESAGGKILMPKTQIGKEGCIAHMLDTEGNRIGLHSRK